MPESDIRRGFLEVEPELLSWILGMASSKPPVRMSATGDAWHWEGRGNDTPFVLAAIELTGESSPPVRVRWWANVLRPGAEYKSHKHDGKWSFVYHLTEGSPLHFTEASFPATPGQILVFRSTLPHWTDKVDVGPRVSIAGNLHFRNR
jgi:hypothetical protein